MPTHTQANFKAEMMVKISQDKNGKGPTLKLTGNELFLQHLATDAQGKVVKYSLFDDHNEWPNR